METRPRPAADSRVNAQVPWSQGELRGPSHVLCPVLCQSVTHPGPRPDTNLIVQIQSTEQDLHTSRCSKKTGFWFVALLMEARACHILGRCSVPEACL